MPKTIDPAAIVEQVILHGDLSSLSVAERLSYYKDVCDSAGLNPLTKPFAYIELNGKLTLYALKSATDQLRQIHDVSVTQMSQSERDGIFVVQCQVVNALGRTDMAIGAVNIAKLQGEALANALMKAETKAKRRATLSICGLSLLDETEVEDIPSDVKALPKKDAREIFKKLQDEIRDKNQTYPGFKLWLDDNAERIRTMPPDWQDILRAMAHERLVELRQLGANDKPREVGPVPTVQDPEAVLKWVDEILSKVDDIDKLMGAWEIDIVPVYNASLPPDQEEMQGIYRRHEERLSG